MRIIILGVNGYLGINLAKYLSQKNNSIVGLVRRPFSSEYCQVVNINHPEWKQFILNFNPELIINTVTCYGRNGESINEILEANVTFPIKIIDSILEENKNFRIINCGSSLPKNINLYSLTKHHLNEIFIHYSHLHNIDYINLNLEGFYGIQCHNSFINNIFQLCIRGDEIKLTLGEQYRDYIYIEDLLTAIETVIQHIHQFSGYDEIDIGTGNSIQIKKLVEKICNLTGYNKEPLYGALKYRDHELMKSCADISALSSLGWEASHNIDSGLSELYLNEFK
jgi:CDP-paratose synthetase